MKTYLISYTEKNPIPPRHIDYGEYAVSPDHIHIYAVYTDAEFPHEPVEKMLGRMPDFGFRICGTPPSGGDNPFNLQPDSPLQLS